MTQERVYPTIQKTMISTVYEFNFIEKDEEGNFTETETQERTLAKTITSNALKLALTKEFPDKVVNLKRFKRIKTKYVMKLEDFIKNAESEIVPDKLPEEVSPEKENEITVL